MQVQNHHLESVLQNQSLTQTMDIPRLVSIQFLILFTVSFHKNVNCHLFPLAARIQLPGTPSPPGSLWPLPQSQDSTFDLISVDTKEYFRFSVNVPDCGPLNEAIARRYTFEQLFDDVLKPDETRPILSTVEIRVPTNLADNLCDQHLKLNADVDYEKYNLSISVRDNAGSAVISANNVWGALRGLETFSQLVWENSSHLYVNVTEISDWPRFPHRGLMIDSARHFLSPDVILQILDGMSYVKLNVLHWHLVDDQSFPFVSRSFPNLSAQGAYLPGTLEYSPEMVQLLIEEARLRGIRVILEFDTPGHTLGFGKGYPELLTPCYGVDGVPGTPNYALPPLWIGHGPYEILDPTRNYTYEFMKEFFSEIVHNVTRDAYVHLGMDEVYYYCWESSPVIAEFMVQNGYTEYSQVLQHYSKIHLDMVKGLGAKIIIWQDPVDYGVKVDKDVILQIWKSSNGSESSPPWQDYFLNALDLGHQVILSSCWYLNLITYGESWKDYYECDPVLSLEQDISEEQVKLILGGEAAIWAEYVDSTNILPRIFPFVNAVAEKLWSPMNSSTVDDAKWRLDEHRCRMLWRGLPAQPIYNGYCSGREYKFTTVPDKSSAGSSVLKISVMVVAIFISVTAGV